MKAIAQPEPQATPENIIPLDVDKPKSKPAAKNGTASQFRIVEFTNRAGSKSWRVTGWTREGKRIRENFPDIDAAQCRQIELTGEYLQRHSDTITRPTKLTEDQLRLSEAAVLQLGDDWPSMISAITYWQQHGKQRASVESPRLDDAVDQYLVWLAASPFRDATKRHWKTRMKMFRDGMVNMRVADVTAEAIHEYLSKRKVSESGRDTDRRAISRFFSWCIEQPRKWSIVNPCRSLPKAQKGESAPIQVLNLKECDALLKKASREGLAPYVAVCLFGGLRPFEARRLTWQAVNLHDREIRLESNQVKTGRKSGRGRTVAICDTLHAWLKAHKGKPFYPKNWRKKFDRVKLAAGFGTPDEGEKSKLKPWVSDGMRHTAISHYFRKTGSYGLTAEQFGNSESIIKKNYQGKVSTADTKSFYALKPKTKGKK